jgi:hypothetical protein
MVVWSWVDLRIVDAIVTMGDGTIRTSQYFMSSIQVLTSNVVEFLGPTIAPMKQPLIPHVKLESVDRGTQRTTMKEKDAFNEIRQVVGQKLHKIKVLG